MKIGDVAERAGVSADTVRLYEKIGLLNPANRTRAGYRDFDDDVPTRVADIKVLQGVGLSLEEIRAVMQVDPTGRHSCGAVEPALAATVARLDSHIAQLAKLRDAAETTRSSCASGSCGTDSGCRAAVC